MKQGIRALLLACAASLASVPAAAPANVSVGSGNGSAHVSALNLGITGGPDADRISITLDGTQTQYVMTSSRPINPPSPPCTQISTFQISCPIAGFVSFSASLGRGNDRFTVGPSIEVAVTVAGSTGHDVLRTARGADTLLGGVGHDRLFGNNGGDTLRGGKGADVLTAGEGRDELIGGKGNDGLRGGPGRDVEKQ
jgi:Ca2+-binding RTX toxin-like protein